MTHKDMKIVWGWRELKVALLTILIVAGGCFAYRTQIAHFAWYSLHLSSVASSLDSRDATMNFDIANYFFSGPHYDLKRAEAYFKKTLSVDSAFPRAHYQLARVYFLNGRFDQAQGEIDAEIRLYPDFKKSYYIKGLILGYAGELEGAVAGFKAFIARDDFNWAGWNDLSWAYFKQGDYTSARDAAQEGLKRAEGNPWLLNSLGIALMNLGERAEAKSAFTEALSRLDAMTPADWGRSYPGNSPAIYSDGLAQMRESVALNLSLVETARVDSVR